MRSVKDADDMYKKLFFFSEHRGVLIMGGFLVFPIYVLIKLLN